MTDEERTVVKTYVPRSQKEAWVEHAESLDMSQSEFLRTMVQAGRRGFDSDPAETPSSDATPGGRSLEERVRSALAESGVLDWDEVVARVAGDVERDVDEALGRLQERGAVRHSGPDGGYVLTRDRAVDRGDADGDSRRPRGEGEERATGDPHGRRPGASGGTDPGPRREPADPPRVTERERREVDDRSEYDDGPVPERRRADRSREGTTRPRRSREDPPRGDGPRDESLRRPRREDRPATDHRGERPRNGSPEGSRRESDRRPREDRRRPADASRREDRHPPVESLREARESLDGPGRREDGREDEYADEHRTERVTDEERYDER